MADRRLGALVSGARFGQFVSVGAVGTVFDTLTLATLGLVFSVPEFWAKAVGVEVAVLVMFVVNERWTFAGEGAAGRRPFLRRLGKSHLVRSGGVAVQLAVYWVLTARTPVELVVPAGPPGALAALPVGGLWATVAGRDLWFLAASPVAIAVAMVVNYVAESLFTWRVGRDRPRDQNP